MKSEPPFVLKKIVASRGEVVGLLDVPGSAVLIQRERPRWLMLLCPCGCGDEIPINLDSKAGPAWRIFKNPKYGYSLYPSVWRDTGCESHFIIWRNQILLFGRMRGSYRSKGRNSEIIELSHRVLKRFPVKVPISYVEISEAMGEVPWDVLDACRQLVKIGAVLEEDEDEQFGFFRRCPKKRNFLGFKSKLKAPL